MQLPLFQRTDDFFELLYKEVVFCAGSMKGEVRRLFWGE